MATLMWRRVRSGGLGWRVLSAYIALVFAVAVIAPGLTVYAAEGESEEATSAAAAVVSSEPDLDQGDQGGEPSVDSSEAADPAVVDKGDLPEATKEVKASVAPTVRGLSVTASMASVVLGTSSKLSFTFEGVRKSSGWVTGNLKEYDEGNWVPYRVVLHNSDGVNSVSVPAISIVHDHYVSASNAIMFDATRGWGYYITSTTPASGDPWLPSGTALTPASQDVPQGGVWGTGSKIKTSFNSGVIVIPPGEYAVLYFQAHLAVTVHWNQQTPARGGAGYVSGSSGHASLSISGVGAKTVPNPTVVTPTGAITIYKYQDDNENNVHNTAEAMLSGWAFTVTDAEGASVGSGTTGAEGTLTLTGLPAGVYTVTETSQTGWDCTGALAREVTVTDDATASVWFGNIELGGILIHKYLDADEDGVYDVGEAMLADWEFSVSHALVPALSVLSIDGSLVTTGTTNTDGELAVAGLRPGKYAVSETLPSGWHSTTGAEVITAVVQGAVTEVWFGNAPDKPKPGTLVVHKFFDENEDGLFDEDEPMLSGWTFTLYNSDGVEVDSGTTDLNGEIIFAELAPGSYRAVETLQEGWDNTTALQQDVTISENETSDLWFGNVEYLPYTELDLAITKKASTPSVGAGDVVTYTLTWWNNGDLAATDYTIVDDFDERYVTIVDAAGGTVANGKITWHFAGPLSSEDGAMSLSYKVRIAADVPDSVSAVDNVVVISHPDDADLTNNTDNERVTIEAEPYLPYTGSEALLLLGVALAAAAIGITLRVKAARTK